MRRITAGALAAAVGASVLLISGPAAADRRTDLKVDLIKIDPNPVRVKRGEATSVTFDVVSKGAARVEVSLKPLGPKHHRFTPKVADVKRDAGGGAGRRDAAKEEAKPAEAGRGRGPGRPVERVDLTRFVAGFTAKDPAGKWLATAVAFDRSGKKVTDTETFAVELVKSGSAPGSSASAPTRRRCARASRSSSAAACSRRTGGSRATRARTSTSSTARTARPAGEDRRAETDRSGVFRAAVKAYAAASTRPCSRATTTPSPPRATSSACGSSAASTTSTGDLTLHR